MAQGDKAVMVIVWVVGVTGGLFFVGMIWVAVHFIVKFW